MPTTAAPTITDARFNALKAKLRELFELDKSDLDFGIYRIMAAKNTEVTEFLDRQLKDVVRETLAAHGAGATDQIQAELDKAIEQALELGADPDTVPKVQQLRARLETGAGAAGADLEADIYNHLLAFFSRYYDEGDFISKRRYKGDTYAIPYSGEEVVLHWANKDQYYIKSGEWHKDYRFKPPGAAGKRVRFKLVEATQEAGNNKEPDEAKRRYILDTENPIESTENELTLRFQFRAPTEAEKTAVEESEATRIFGGKYDKPSGRTKGDEREQFCADAEKRALEALGGAGVSTAWRSLVTAAAPTEAKPSRTILGKHLDEFTARNTFDYFIHKDLGGFLRRELDFYIKNEVVRLDDLEALADSHLAQVQSKIKAIRKVAGRIIDFLAAIEDFQKKMWLKKKLVLDTNWLVTIDRIPTELRDVVAANEAQWAEWESLGFKPADNNGDGELFGGAVWGTREYLDACEHLVVNTRYFDRQFSSAVLATENILGTFPTLHSAVLGLLVHSENFGAIQLLAQCFERSVQSIYIDPPYNTDNETDPFLYKDRYKHSSWAAMMLDRYAVSMPLLSPLGLCFTSCDSSEHHRLRGICEIVYGASAFVESFTWIRAYNPSNLSKRFRKKSESILCFEPLLSNSPFRGEKLESQDSQPLYNAGNAHGTLVFPIGTVEFGEDSCELEPGEYGKGPIILEKPLSVTDHRNSTALVLRGPFRWRQETLEEELKKGTTVRIARTSEMQPRFLRSIESNFKTPDNLLIDKTLGVSSNEEARDELEDLFGEVVFDYPKPTNLMAYLFGFRTSNDGLVLDYFAGSGSTGHAVVTMNRRVGKDGKRRFVLVDSGVYFGSRANDRIAKVVYSPDWAGGKAQSHEAGVSAVVKYFALESYEDALNNLPSPTSTDALLQTADGAARDAMLTYSLDLELGPHLLNLDAFRDPWGYSINAQLAGEDEIKPHRVDLVETFNYLIGLKVRAYGPMERYAADFERAEHEDNLGRLKLTGRLRRDADGPYVFQRVEGELNDGNDTRVLVVWRKLTDDPEKDAAVLEAWMQRHAEDTRQRSEHRDYHIIYINGPVTLPQPTQEIRTVFPTEETFKAKMFEDSSGLPGSGMQ